MELVWFFYMFHTTIPARFVTTLCEPNMDVNVKDPDVFQQPNTAVARVLCLCLMSFHSSIRSLAWRNAARSNLHTWRTSFDYEQSQIPEEELQQTPPDSDYTSSEFTGSEYLPSSPSQCTEQGRRMPTRSQSNPSNGQYQRTARFCTQRCLLCLQHGDLFDERCPNVNHLRLGQDGDRHRIDAKTLVRLLKKQLDQDLDHNCTPFGTCGFYGAPFKTTCAEYGYTVVGKGTTSRF